MALGIFPYFAWVVLGLPKMHAASFSDAYYYFAYAHNFVDLVERYGMIYYAVRFGAIFPDWIFGSLFGPVGGFLTLRYVLCVATCASLFRFFSLRYSGSVGWFAVAFWMFNPFVLKMMLSPYVTSTAIPFAMCGLLLLLTRTQSSSVSQKFGSVGFAGAMVAGALFCLSATSNIFAAITIGFGGLAWIAWSAPNGWRPIVLTLFGCVVGAVGVMGAASLVYLRLFDMPNILSPTIDSIVSLGSGGSVNWTRPPAEWLADSPMIFAPPLLAAAGLVLGWRLRENALVSLSAALAGMTGFYWWLDLFRDGYALSFWPYFQFLLPLIVLVVAESFGVVVKRGSPAGKRWIPSVAIFVVFLGGWQFARFTFPAISGWTAWLLAGAAVVLLIPILTSQRFRAGAWLGIFVSCVALMALTGRILIDPNRAIRDDMSIALAGLDLTGIVRKFAGKSDCRFWYSGSFDDTTTLAQSAHLNFFSRIGIHAEFPEIDAPMKANLGSAFENYLIVLGTPEELESGLSALAANKISAVIIHRQVVERDDVHFEVAVCRVSVLDRYDWREIDLWVPPDADGHDVRVIKQSGYQTGRDLWEGELLGVVSVPPGEFLNAVRLTLSVERGRVQVVVLSGDATLKNRELASMQIGRTSGLRDVIFTFPPQQRRVLVVVQNAWVSGVPSTGLVQSAYVGSYAR